MNENKKLIPKRRFKEFKNAGAWEQRRLGEVMVLKRGLTYKTSDITNTGIRVLRSSNIKENQFTLNDDDIFVKTEAINIDYAKNNDILITAANGSPNLVGKHSIIQNISDNSCVHGGFMLLGRSIDYKFINSSMSSNWYKEFIRKNALGGNGSIGNLSKDLLEKEVILFPNHDEKKSIGLFFQSLDTLITLHQRKLEKVKSLKSALLSEMFPAEGESKPKRRFKGFTDDWEQRRLGDVADFSKGKGYSKKDLKDIGSPIILYGKMYTDYELEIESVNTFTSKKPNSVTSLGSEVIIPSSGESREDIARATAILSADIVIGGDLNIIYPKIFINATFLAATMSCGKERKDISRKAQGKSIVHLHNSEIKSINITYPKLDEQKKIVILLRTISNLITLHQRKLEKLENVKKAYLNEMFV